MSKVAQAVCLSAVAALALAGCDKKVQLTIVNHTPDMLDVKVTTPDQGTMSVGTVGGNGSKLRHTIKIANDDLPAQCSVKAGMATAAKTFTVNEDTKGELWFHVDRDGIAGPMDKNTPYIRHTDPDVIEIKRGTRTVVD